MLATVSAPEMEAGEGGTGASGSKRVTLSARELVSLHADQAMGTFSLTSSGSSSLNISYELSKVFLFTQTFRRVSHHA